MPATVLVRQNGTGDYTTLTAGIAAVDTAGIVYVGSGTYTEEIDLTTYGGGFTKVVHIIAESGTTPVWDGTSATNPAFAMTAVRSSSGSGITPRFEGLTFNNWTVANAVFNCNTRMPINVSGCFFNSCGQITKNLTGTAGEPAYFRKNFYKSCGLAIHANFSCYIYAFNNIYIGNTFATVLAANSFIYNNTLLTAISDSTIPIQADVAINNIIVNQPGKSATSRPFNCVSTGSYNLVSGTWGNVGNAPFLTGNISGSGITPAWTNSASYDFTIGSTSSAINAGTYLSIVTNDYSGTARVSGAYDIGAFEYLLANAWTGFTGSISGAISSGFINNYYINLSSQWSRRSGVRSDQNGSTVVDQVPFGIGQPGPVSIRGRDTAYTLVPSQNLAESGSLKPNPLGY